MKRKRDRVVPVKSYCGKVLPGALVIMMLIAIIGGNPSTALAVRLDPQYTPLMEACAAGDIGVVKRLIENGADVNERNKHGGTPLSVACYRGKLDVAKLLLERGANPNVRTPGSGLLSLLMDACVRGNLDLVRLLVEHGADINERNRSGYTALALLANHIRLRDERTKKDNIIIKYLKSRGATE
ncbi:MAG: ankyrin repeat domain-containing protein [Desulfomonile tiedjei]|nr:ankyrin repeat domain-containing protein [Desulfomonile tiedjei]